MCSLVTKQQVRALVSTPASLRSDIPPSREHVKKNVTKLYRWSAIPEWPETLISPSPTGTLNNITGVAAKDLSELQNGCCSNTPKRCFKARTGGKAVRKVGCSRVRLRIVHQRKRLTNSPISVEVKDISLTDYIQIRHAVYLPHTAGRYAKKQFKKAQMPIVERLVDRYVIYTNGF